MWPIKVVLLYLIVKTNAKIKGQGIVGNPLLHAHPCSDNENITVQFEPGRPPEEENQYGVWVDEYFGAYYRVDLVFDSEATLTLADPSVARISSLGNTFTVKFFKNAQNLSFRVQGPLNGSIPYFTSFTVNHEEMCNDYKTGFLDSYRQGYRDTAEVHLSVPDETCGRRKVQHTALITNGLATKAGDWPWHAAIYRLNGNSIKYICGGTLLSKNFVLTAAHCASIRGSPVLPETLSVVLGKYNLIGGDVATQEKEVHEIIIHKEFTNKNLNNDIALLKLKTEVAFDDYVQPACMWYADVVKKLPQGNIFGTVVGWGFDHTDSLSPQLRQATMPKVSESVCIKSNPVSFGKLLTERKFCAGWLNGTSACNGDSGGGFHVFVPDSSTSSANQGAYYVRGIVSLSLARQDVALCDTAQYVVFTDVAGYRGWITKYVQ